ncbi:MAG TPA: endopeptidase La [Candidatus Alectryocaccobium stercorigallinarum]|nr:endopeptidase La [Candidatus Alectryocaccobium stercorigallinarum]
MSDLIKVMPVIALRGTIVMPDMIMHFDISRSKSIKAVEKAMLLDQRIFLVAQKDINVDDPNIDDVYKYGTIGTIKQVFKLPNNLIRVLVEGNTRAQLIEFVSRFPYLEAEIIPFEDTQIRFESEEQKEAMRGELRDLFIQYAEVSMKISRDLVNQIVESDSVEKMVNQIIVQIPCTLEQEQELLEAIDPKVRYERVCDLLAHEVNVYNIRKELQEKIKQSLDKNQRDYILREQIKIIREELGEDDSQSQIDEYKKKASELIAPKAVKERILKEISRLETYGSNNPAEGGVIRGYIETLLSLPWDKMSQDNEDISRARKILEEDHYGLEKIKERVLEFLAVRTLKKKGESPILCLVGPPGTGKTSIGKSIARALDKKYLRISLGGIHDEAEIRGHRRTYIGAMPGRIVEGLRQAGVKNPLFLLDEIDKVSSDFRGDTSSALLEVLDPEQNVRFSDHYIDMPIDLSEVLFIATANNAANIPRPLLDRMEIIEVTSYTENEKYHIAKEHLIPKQMDANGIAKKELSITDKAIGEIISGYTKEAGVRQLERYIGKICRKAALMMKEEDRKKVSVGVNNLKDFLGRIKYHAQKANPKPEVGIVRGLAWTSVGGETLQIEVNIMPGKGELRLTGQLGDVMKESAMAGISYIRSVAKKYNIKDEFFTDNDIHIHIPEGAVPKDGPSAGITMATAMLSAITNIPVYADVAMTGEITLRGRVLPIGGLKEKMLAAKKAGMKKVVVPHENQSDVQEMDEEITGGMEIVFVEKMDQVIKEAFVNDSKKGDA